MVLLALNICHKTADKMIACELALHLGDIVKSTRARGTREETRLRGAGKKTNIFWQVNKLKASWR